MSNNSKGESAIRVLGIETSCDDTGVGLYDTEQGLLGHLLFSQIETHREFGGVVPELAARDHLKKVLPLVDELLQKCACSPKSLDAVAYTQGPGLAGALLAGSATAKGLAKGWGIPTIGVHHMEGHLLAAMLESDSPQFPMLALLVSGGHTMLISVKGLGDYTILGQTLDDAVGEAFDKTAKLLSLGYPGGPAIEKLAREGVSGQFEFPRPMLNREGFDFSYSGLKTSVKMAIDKLQAQGDSDSPGAIPMPVKATIAHCFQEAALEVLVTKSQRALKHTDLKTLVVAGGVGANSRLRELMNEMASGNGVDVFYPRMEFCTDNGAMIAYAGAQRPQQFNFAGEFQVKPRWSLETLESG